jgi:hypothetical protein
VKNGQAAEAPRPLQQIALLKTAVDLEKEKRDGDGSEKMKTDSLERRLRRHRWVTTPRGAALLSFPPSHSPKSPSASAKIWEEMLRAPT